MANNVGHSLKQVTREDNMGEKTVIATTRTVTVTQFLGLDSYDGMTAQEAVDFEKDLSKVEKIQSVMELLECRPRDEIILQEMITIQTDTED